MTIELLSEQAKTRLNKMCPAGHLAEMGTKLEAICSYLNALTEGDTPVNAVAATGKLTIGASNAAADDTVTVGDVTYTFKTALSDPAEANEVLIGASATATAANLVLAILAEGTDGEVGVKYSTGTTTHPLVTASSDAGVVTFTAKAKGAAGNEIALSKEGDGLTVSGDTLGTGAGVAEGVDGTVGIKGQITFDSTNLYICLADNTVSGTNWKKITLSNL